MSDVTRPIASLIAKSEKARQKLAPGTWQYAMLGDNLDALRIAIALMAGDKDAPDRLAQDRLAPARFSPDDLRKAIRAIAAMIARSEQAQAKAAPGSAQHALLRNRITALHAAQSAIDAVLDHNDT